MKLLSPQTDLSRPILDRVKQSLFDCLTKYDMPAGKIAADVFCGVGSLGLEALSRGAKFVTFVEKDPKTVSILRKNIEKAGFVDQSKVIIADAFKTGVGIGIRHKNGGQVGKVERGISAYDIVFVDPPYIRTNDVGAGSDLDKLLKILADQVADKALVIVRTHKKIVLPDIYSGFKIIERREWGSMAITFLKRALST